MQENVMLTLRNNNDWRTYMYYSIISFCKASQKKGGNGSIEESNETTSEMSQSDEYIKTVHEFSNVLVFVCKL